MLEPDDMMSQPYNHICLFGWREIYWSNISNSSVNSLAVCPLFHNFYLPLDEGARGKVSYLKKFLLDYSYIELAYWLELMLMLALSSGKEI